MDARTVWILAVVTLLFSGCKRAGVEEPPAAPAAGEPQEQAAAQVDAGAPPAETASGDAGAGAAEKPGSVVRHIVIEPPEVTREEMNDPAFPKTVPPQARKAIIRLRKLQQTDPRFQRKPSGVPTPPPEEEHGVKGRKKQKRRNK